MKGTKVLKCKDCCLRGVFTDVCDMDKERPCDLIPYYIESGYQNATCFHPDLEEVIWALEKRREEINANIESAIELQTVRKAAK